MEVHIETTEPTKYKERIWTIIIAVASRATRYCAIVSCK